MAKKKNTDKESKETKEKGTASKQTKTRLLKKQKEKALSHDLKTEMPSHEPEIVPHFAASSPHDVEIRIASRAYDLYQRRGRYHGQDLDDWLEAEHQVLGENQGF